jgi:hypothetical protein
MLDEEVDGWTPALGLFGAAAGVLGHGDVGDGVFGLFRELVVDAERESVFDQL